MKKAMFCLLLSLSIATLFGCVTIDPSLMMKKTTKIEIKDVTTNWSVSTAVANGDQQVKMIRNRLMENTKEELSKRGLQAYLLPIDGAAILKYDVRTINSGYSVIGGGFGVIGRDNFEVKYRVSLVSPEGKELWTDKDEKDESDLDEVLEKIASRVASRVSIFFSDGDK